MFLCPLRAHGGMPTVQIHDQFSTILAELFADAPYVKQLGYDALGTSVIVLAVFDDNDGADYSERLGEVVRRLMKFEKRVVGGIMPEMDLRPQVAATGRGWSGEMEGMTAVIGR